ncbi:MAG: KilA-N domain-containing protein [Bacteroidota bacterium]
MKPEILSRPFLGYFVEQQSKSGLFNATDLGRIANNKRAELGLPDFDLQGFLKKDDTMEFVEELQKTTETVLSTEILDGNPIIWVHPYLFIDIALSISPKLKVEVYSWLLAEIVRSKNDAGENYKKMTAALSVRINDPREFTKYIERVANSIKKSCGVDDWKKANQNQLMLRDKIYENISLLCSVLENTDECVSLGVKKTLEADAKKNN